MGNRLSPEEDAKRYRDGYPDDELPENVTKQNSNIRFYENKLRSRPDGGFIDDIHRKWWGDYHLLEVHHGYIQWLFPIREEGMNGHAQRLFPHEIQHLKNNAAVRARLTKSYEMMLHFYGMKLTDPATGQIERGDNYGSRYRHLDRSFHNYLRITRILKCLGELGLEHLKSPFVEHILTEILEHDMLTECLKSCTDYWGPVVRSEPQRTKLGQLARQVYLKRAAAYRARQAQFGGRYSDPLQRDKKTDGENGGEVAENGQVVENGGEVAENGDTDDGDECMADMDLYGSNDEHDEYDQDNNTQESPRGAGELMRSDSSLSNGDLDARAKPETEAPAEPIAEQKAEVQQNGDLMKTKSELPDADFDEAPLSPMRVDSELPVSADADVGAKETGSQDKEEHESHKEGPDKLLQKEPNLQNLSEEALSNKNL